MQRDRTAVEIPLRNRRRELVGIALVSDEDRHLAAHTWHLQKRGNVARMVRGSDGRQRSVLLHRTIMGLHTGDGLEVDHINGDRLDNRRENLRVVTHAQNMQNVAKSAPGTRSSGARGVRYRPARGKWEARGTIVGKRVFIGHFDTEAEAAHAASRWRESHMPFSNEARHREQVGMQA